MRVHAERVNAFLLVTDSTVFDSDSKHVKSLAGFNTKNVHSSLHFLFFFGVVSVHYNIVKKN